MNCKNCGCENFFWRSEILPNDNDPHALVSIHCSLCDRMYQACIPRENFKLMEKGNPKGEGPRHPKQEELVSPEEVREFTNSFQKKLK